MSFAPPRFARVVGIRGAIPGAYSRPPRPALQIKADGVALQQSRSDRGVALYRDEGAYELQ